MAALRSAPPGQRHRPAATAPVGAVGWPLRTQPGDGFWGGDPRRTVILDQNSVSHGLRSSELGERPFGWSTLTRTENRRAKANTSAAGTPSSYARCGCLKTRQAVQTPRIYPTVKSANTRPMAPLQVYRQEVQKSP